MEFWQNKTDWTFQRVRRYALACPYGWLTGNAVLSVTLRIVLSAAPLLSPTMDRSRQILRPSSECMPNRRFADRQSHSLHDDQQGARPERHAMHPPGGPHVIHQ